MQTVVATMNYGCIRRNVSYKMVSVGRDYIIVSVKGRPVYVPNWAFDPDNERFYRENEEE